MSKVIPICTPIDVYILEMLLNFSVYNQAKKGRSFQFTGIPNGSKQLHLDEITRLTNYKAHLIYFSDIELSLLKGQKITET